MLKRLRTKLFGNWWGLSALIAVVAALVLAVGLPIFVGALRPLWIRVTCVLLVAAGWGFAAWWRWRKARRASDAIAAELTAGDAETQALAGRMTQALATLRGAAGKNRAYLYTKPWYVIIGPPGAGKTTALVNSGLRFPVGEQALAGVGGTRNLDFWFADEAALVDTAGRYTTQDSDAEVDAKGWTGFLKLLRQHRPLQPINGVMVAIGVDELMTGDRARIDAHASAVRQRLLELRRTLAVAAPVYVLLTKADLLAGFTEFYDDLDVEGRRAVLGATLPWTGATPDMAALAGAWDGMAQGIADRQAKRVFEEVDAARRSAVLGFPAQIAALRARLLRFLEGALVAGDEKGGVLRGFYLTSGVQQGTPVDRILAGVADAYAQPHQPEPMAPAMAGSGSRGGRAYFLNRLLADVMFPEAGLVTFDPAARRRQRLQLAGALGGIAALAVLVMIGWGISFGQNRGLESELASGAATAKRAADESGIDLREVRESDPSLTAALPLLDSLRGLPRGYAVRQNGAPPLLMTLGLYQSGLSQRADASYREALRRIMLPRLLLRLEQILRAGGDPAALYEPLKVYLMLGGQGPMDRSAVQSFVAEDWATTVFPGSDSAGEREALERHLTALLTDPDLSASWANRRAPLDGALVARTRVAVQTLNLTDRAYAILKQKAAGAGGPWQAGEVLSPGDAQAFADPDAVLSARVPFIFTRAGYDRAYILGLAKVQDDLRRDLWVLGAGKDQSGIRMEMANIRPGVAGHYAQDYIAAWEGIIKLMKPGAYFTDPQALAAFTKSPSPLKRVLLEVRKNTMFASGKKDLANRIAMRQFNKVKTFRKFGVKPGDLVDDEFSAGDAITAYFASLRAYAGDGHGNAPVDELVNAVKGAGEAVIAAKSTGGAGGADATQAGMATAMAKVATAAAGVPGSLKDFAAAAAKGGVAAQTTAVSGAVTDAYAQAVLPACRQLVQDHYPFLTAAAQDAPVPEMLRVFGMGGVLDGFVQQRLAAMIDTAGPVWRWKASDPRTATLDPRTPEEMAKVAQLRDLLAGGLPLHISVVAWGSDAREVEFAANGASYRFQRGSADEKPIQWSATGGVPQADVAVTGGAAGKELLRVSAEGPWAIFRLMDQAAKENSGPQAFKASFGDGARRVTFLVKLPSEHNPFSRGGVWSFRCPTLL